MKEQNEDILNELEKLISSPKRSPRVVLVSGSCTLHHIIFPILISYGYEVERIPNPLEALEILKSGKIFDVILCDGNLPYIKASEFVQIVKSSSQLSKIPIVVTGSFGIDESEKQLKQEFIEKNHYLDSSWDEKQTIKVVTESIRESYGWFSPNCDRQLQMLRNKIEWQDLMAIAKLSPEARENKLLELYHKYLETEEFTERFDRAIHLTKILKDKSTDIYLRKSRSYQMMFEEVIQKAINDFQFDMALQALQNIPDINLQNGYLEKMLIISIEENLSVEIILDYYCQLYPHLSHDVFSEIINKVKSYIDFSSKTPFDFRNHLVKSCKILANNYCEQENVDRTIAVIQGLSVIVNQFWSATDILFSIAEVGKKGYKILAKMIYTLDGELKHAAYKLFLHKLPNISNKLIKYQPATSVLIYQPTRILQVDNLWRFSKESNGEFIFFQNKTVNYTYKNILFNHVLIEPNYRVDCKGYKQLNLIEKNNYYYQYYYQNQKTIQAIFITCDMVICLGECLDNLALILAMQENNYLSNIPVFINSINPLQKISDELDKNLNKFDSTYFSKLLSMNEKLKEMGRYINTDIFQDFDNDMIQNESEISKFLIHLFND